MLALDLKPKIISDLEIRLEMAPPIGTAHKYATKYCKFPFSELLMKNLARPLF